MMEALDQQQANLTSNIDAGDASGTSARVGLDVGAGAASGTTSEEEDYEDTHNALGLAKEESTMEHSDNNNADAADDAECVRRKRKKSTDDVIDLTLANGQDSSQMEAEPESETANSEKQTNESETSKESLLAEKEAVSDSNDIVENPTTQCPTIVIESDDERPTRGSSPASVGSVKQEQGEDLLSEEEESAQSSTIPVKEECLEDLPVDEDVELKSDTRTVPSSEPDANEQLKKLAESAAACDDADDDPKESLLTRKDEEEIQQGSPVVREIINVESDSEEEEEADGYLSARGDLDIDTESEEEASAATEKEDAERSLSVKEQDTESDSGEEDVVVPVAVKGDLDIGTEIAEEDDDSQLLVKESETEDVEQSSSVKELNVGAESGEEITEEDVDSSLSIKASETEDAERSSSIKELDVEEEEAAENRSVKEDLDNDTESEEDAAADANADADPALPIKEDVSVKHPETTKDLDEETVSAEENISLPLKKGLDEDTESAQEALSLSIKKDLEEDSESETETRTAVRSTSAEKDLEMNAEECKEDRSPNNVSMTRDGLASDEEFDAKASPQSSRKSSVAESSDSEDSVTLTMDVDHPCSEDEAADARPGVVKIESDSEEGQQMEESLKSTNSAAAPSPIPDVDVAPQVKVNGIHDAPIPEDSVKEELEEHDQLSVISNHTANEDDEDEGEREREDVEEASTSQQPPMRTRPLILPVRRSRSRSTSRSSTISSASQHQLVIDHPTESEQHSGKVQALKLSLKRRRSSRQSISSAASANSVSQPEKQMKVKSSTSLLLQRLQGNDGTTVNADSVSNPPASREQEQEQCQLATKKEPEPKKERFYRCAKCGTVHQSWNFFAHVRDVHQKFVCMYCSLTYATVEKLSLHLENKHDIDQKHYPKGAWAAEQQKDDRIRYLICCTCQTTFTQGLDFENHDCAELMVPCAQCGVKGCHAMACRNQKKKPPKRRRRVRKQQTDQQQQQQQTQAVPMEPQQAALQTEPAENIPAPMHNWPTIDADTVPVPTPTPPPAIPKLVVPKIMLRVPKEFQKSVDAALSSTDTEEEESELQTAAPLEREAETNPSPSPQTPPPAPPQSRHSLDDSDCALMMSRMQAEVERTEMEIQRIKADRKKQPKAIAPAAVLDDGLLPQHAAEAMEEPLLQAPVQQVQPQQQEEQRRWSLTPPASPHNTTQPPPAIVSEFQADAADEDASPGRRNSLGSDCMDIDDSLNGPTAADEGQFEPPDRFDAVGLLEVIQPVLESPAPPFDGILVAGEDTHTIDLQLNRPLDRFTIVEFVRLCLTAVFPICLYCNHARRIAVNGKQLVLHLIGQHRFTATVDSITAEELYAETIVARLKSFVPQLEEEFLNMSSYCTLESGKYAEDFNERIFECFSCRYVAATHKELYTHNRRMHAKANIMCIMCRTNFYSYSEILCHICPGEEARSVYDLKFRCCLCAAAPQLPSAFRLMVHLRKQHNACDICLEDCFTQARLSAHVWKHKLLHLCYRCGIAYRNKQDISKHLFWKHGTESASCKRCLQKRWPHVYHFCVPPVTFPCEDCGFSFSKAIYLEVHKRMHSGDFRYACAEELCEEKFVSRKLLLKHASTHEAKEDLNTETTMPEQEQKEDSQPLEQAIKKETEEGVREETSQQEAETKTAPFEEKETKTECTKVEPDEKKETGAEQPAAKSETRKRRKKSKRNKEYLEDLNLIAPNLSESDSSDSSDSDAPPRRSGSHGHETLPMRSTVEDLGMPKVMLSPSSESDADDQKSQPSEKPQQPLEGGEKKPSAESKEQAKETPKAETEADAEANVNAEVQVAKREEQPDDVSDMWKNLLQNQTVNPNSEEELPAKEEAQPAELENPPPPSKVHVAWSDHDYCKMYRTPAPSPVKKHSTSKASHAGKRSGKNNASSDSDSSSSSSSNSDSDSSSCSCGSNCSCSSSNSSSSSDDSDDSDSSNAAAAPTKRMRKKSLKQKKNEATGKQMPQPDPEEEINVTSAPEEQPVPPPPSPKAPLYNESDFDTAFSDTDEEFYDAHPQKLASEMLAQKREALLAEHPPVGPRNNYDIVENSRPSTPSLPEEATAYADKPERVRNKKKKRERKSTCKSGKLQLLASTPLPAMEPPSIASQMLPAESPSLLPVTPLTHRHLQPGGYLGLGSRMSEGSSCSDADGQLKRSKRQRRPNKFYGYTSDDENMSTILAPPLLVGMQLIKPQPPPLLTWAKEDLPTPPKQRSRNNNNNSSHHHSHLHSNGGMRTPPTGSGSRKRNRQRSQAASGGGSNVSARSAKRHKPHRQEEEKSLPPIPTLKIRPSLLPTSTPPSDSSDSSSEDEEVNVTSLGPPTPQIQMPPALAMPTAPPVVVPVQLPPPPPPAATAFNQPIPPALLPNPDFATLQYFKANNIRYPIRPPAGARLAREGESVYCYCRCPYDEVSEMIACDGDNCLIEWFHFECVGIMVAPQGRWFCAECRPKYSEGLYPSATAQ